MTSERLNYLLRVREALILISQAHLPSIKFEDIDTALKTVQAGLDKIEQDNIVIK
jgi:hypothetical protein